MKEYLIWFAKFATVVVFFFFVVPFLLIAVGAAAGAGAGIETDAKERVAVVELTGMIMDSREIVKQLHTLADDTSVKGIVLRINSPGGAVGPSQEIYESVLRLKDKKPIIASMGSTAASGGLYAALGASRIYAQPGTLTGSIGVIIQFPNLTDIADQVGFKMVTVKSGKLKDVGNTFRAMTDEDRAFLQSTVNSIYDEFVRAVVEGRGLDMAAVRKFADGRILTGTQAKEVNLIDDIGDVYTASRAVYDILGQSLPEGEYPELYYPVDKFEKFRKFLEAVLDLPVTLRGTLSRPAMQVLYAM